MNSTIPSLERYRQICYKKSLFIFFLFFYDFSFFSLLLFLLPFSACSLSSVIPSSLFLLLPSPASSPLLFFLFFFSLSLSCVHFTTILFHTFSLNKNPIGVLQFQTSPPFFFLFSFFLFFFFFFFFFPSLSLCLFLSLLFIYFS